MRAGGAFDDLPDPRTINWYANEPGQMLIPGGAWKGSGPVSGVLAVNPQSRSVRAIQAYYPPEGMIEYVFNPLTNTFAVGRPNTRSIGSPHQKLAIAIGADSRVVGGMFKRDQNGSILTNEFSGHFWDNWTPEIREQFKRVMYDYGIPIIHTEGM